MQQLNPPGTMAREESAALEEFIPDCVKHLKVKSEMRRCRLIVFSQCLFRYSDSYKHDALIEEIPGLPLLESEGSLVNSAKGRSNHNNSIYCAMKTRDGNFHRVKSTDPRYTSKSRQVHCLSTFSTKLTRSKQYLVLYDERH